MKQGILMGFVGAGALIGALSLSSNAMAAGAVALSAVSGAVSPRQPRGRFELFASVPGGSGAVFHTWQLADKAGWQPSWTPYFPAPDKNPHGSVAGRDGSGRIVAAWISGGSIHFAEAIHADASLTTSANLMIGDVIDPFDHKSYLFKYLAMGKYPNGRIEVLALSTNGRVYSIRQTALNDDGNPWIGLARSANGQVNPIVNLVGGGDLQSISVTNLNNGLALVGTSKDGKVYAKFQSVVEAWDNDPWVNLDGNQIQDARAAESSAHQLEVIAFGKDKRYYLQFQNVGNATLSGWQMLLRSTSSADRINELVNFGPSFFFSRYKDGTLFMTTHYDTNPITTGNFVKAFQGPNNASWPGGYAKFQATTDQVGPANNPNDLGFLSTEAFTLAADANGEINYFVNYRNAAQVEHYVDWQGAGTNKGDGAHSLLIYQTGEHSIPNLP